MFNFCKSSLNYFQNIFKILQIKNTFISQSPGSSDFEVVTDLTFIGTVNEGLEVRVQKLNDNRHKMLVRIHKVTGSPRVF